MDAKATVSGEAKAKAVKMPKREERKSVVEMKERERDGGRKLTSWISRPFRSPFRRRGGGAIVGCKSVIVG